MQGTRAQQNLSHFLKIALIITMATCTLLILISDRQHSWSIEQIREEIYETLINEAAANLSTTEEGEAILNIGEAENLTQDDVLKKVHDLAPNVLADHVNDTDRKLNDTCAHYVNPYDVKYNNIMWQVQKMPRETYLLFNAYFDNRTALTGEGSFVRILVIIDRQEPSNKSFCQLWFANKPEPTISNVSRTDFLWYKEWGNDKSPYQPYLFSCAVPASLEMVPESVSLVANPCDNATNNLRVIDNRAPLGKKLIFAVCVKAMNFKHQPLVSVKLVEWIEMHKILGADKIFIYELQVHPNTTRVLDYYKAQGLVEVTKLALPGSAPNVPDLMALYMSERTFGIQCPLELIQYTDCLLKNMNLFEFIVAVDVDEVILPLKVDNWYDLIYKVAIPKHKKRTEGIASFVARNVHFMDDTDEYQDWTQGIPKYMHMLQNVHRNASHMEIGDSIKCFHNTDYVLALHNHYARHCLGNYCPDVDFDLEDAHLQHYCLGRKKSECQRKRGKDLVEDTSIWRFKDKLIPATQKVLRAVGIL
ncbi:Hypothetical predicted protein [Cloeon dipterum]|uniref:Glycosyltransferase family 92 protein n=2 Tax=Cloeon dipterum TaxID=197152 RepID=A0A8S1DAR5_9INSE|nr:Hypothetical predicted protein [Cloeon dipterum]